MCSAVPPLRLRRKEKRDPAAESGRRRGCDESIIQAVLFPERASISRRLLSSSWVQQWARPWRSPAQLYAPMENCVKSGKIK
jgi:hypothetical protein